MKNYAIKYYQDEHEFYTTVLTYEYLSKISETLKYQGRGKLGYQRELNSIHYNRIKKSILNRNSKYKDFSALVSPTSIILGINRVDFEKIDKEERDKDLFIFNFDDNIRCFHVIDGQHRIKGIGLAAEEDKELLKYQLNIIILVIEENKKRVEVNVFSDINSKAKPLQMELTILSKYEYELLERSDDIDIDEHIAINAAFKLNDKKGTVWENGIKIDPNNKNGVGIVSFRSFYDSIKMICQNYSEENNTFYQASFEDRISYIDDISEKVVNDILIPFWNIIEQKWQGCFQTNTYAFNLEKYNIRYRTEYYLQKTMGVKALHIILRDELNKYDYNIEKTFISIEDIIAKSNVSSIEWLVGKRFAGLSSESGFKKIAEIINNAE